MVYQIGAFSKKVALSIDTLRFYEKEGLITPARANHLRVYTEQDVLWIEFIKRLKQTGMPIKQIKIYSRLRDIGDTTIAERMTLLDAQKKKLEIEQELIQSHINFINQKITIYKNM